MSSLVLFVAAALLVTGQSHQMPPGMSHEEHLKRMQKDEALKRRGADAMGFDQDAVTQHCRLSPTGGSIEVTVKDRADAASLAAVRSHLRTIASEFTAGRFDKPFQTHGEVPPGVADMQKASQAIAYRYEDLRQGGVVRIVTKDPGAREAVHAFLRYQIVEHRTGEPLQPGR